MFYILIWNKCRSPNRKNISQLEFDPLQKKTKQKNNTRIEWYTIALLGTAFFTYFWFALLLFNALQCFFVHLVQGFKTLENVNIANYFVYCTPQSRRTGNSFVFFLITRQWVFMNIFICLLNSISYFVWRFMTFFRRLEWAFDWKYCKTMSIDFV